MKLPGHPVIAEEKPTRYLLVRLPRNDKSGFLAQAGYLAGNWEMLRDDLLKLGAQSEAEPVEGNKFGDYHSVRGQLLGPNGVALRVQTIWMTEHLSKTTKFITLVPDDSP